MIMIETNKASAMEDSVFSGYAQSGEVTVMFASGKHFGKNLEGAYDQFRNNDIKITSWLNAYTVSDHLELISSQTEFADDIEAIG